MSANTAVATILSPARDVDRAHRTRLIFGYVLSSLLIVSLFIYGFDYYTLSAADRPFSPKHAILRPSGALGIKLGFFGTCVFFAIFLYPLRKRWPWLMRQGNTRHWLDIHVLLGLSAPFIIALHSSFKFHGFAGIAFWIMAAVSASGVVGRYLYSQIPRSLNAAQLSRKEATDLQEKLATELARQRVIPETDLRQLLRLPDSDRVENLPVVVAIPYMMLLDVFRVFRIAALRRHALRTVEVVRTFGGFTRTRHPELERAISTAREEAKLAKRILFLSRSEKVFHLWHVVHKPFSYTFAVLALIHIGVVTAMGYL